jgi:hypothetical protein
VLNRLLAAIVTRTVEVVIKLAAASSTAAAALETAGLRRHAWGCFATACCERWCGARAEPSDEVVCVTLVRHTSTTRGVWDAAACCKRRKRWRG